MRTVFFIIFLFLFGFSGGDKNKSVTIHLLFTNDLHGVFGVQEATFMNPDFPPELSGFAGFVHYKKELLKQTSMRGESVLTLDAGNFFQGHPIATLDSGRSAISFMNDYYDALVPGYYDFIFGERNLRRLDSKSTFPFLGANTFNSKGKSLFKPYIIKEMNGVKVGILGVISSEINDYVLKSNLRGVSTLSEYHTVKQYIPEMRKAGADLVIVLASTGIPYDRELEFEQFEKDLAAGKDFTKTPINSLILARFAEGADIIISGGVSKGYSDPWYDPETHVAVLQNYGGGSEFGHVKLIVDEGTKTLRKIENVSLRGVNLSALISEFPVDEGFLESVEQVNQRAVDKLYQPLTYDENKIKRSPSVNAAKNLTNNFEIEKIGEDDFLEVMTWNLEFFPADKEQTVDALAEVIDKLDLDIIGLQEIRYSGWLSKVMEKLPQYGLIVSQQASFMDLAIIYKKDQLTFLRQVEPFAENDYNYAGRPPLRGDFLYHTNGKKIPVSIINVHMKCCSAGLARRTKAVNQLQEYMATSHDNGETNLIALGDWNDDIKDPPGEHSFDAFFADKRFYFPTQRIVNDISKSTYPHEPWISFLDHILVAEKFLSKDADFVINTLMMDEIVGGMKKYESILSDHRPVYLKFRVE